MSIDHIFHECDDRAAEVMRRIGSPPGTVDAPTVAECIRMLVDADRTDARLVAAIEQAEQHRRVMAISCRLAALHLAALREAARNDEEQPPP